MKRMILPIALLVCGSSFASPGMPPMPSPAPQKDEVVIDGKNDPVVTRCVYTYANNWKDPDQRPIKVVITRSPEWGTIWRADAAILDRGKLLYRERSVCWKDGEREDVVDPKNGIMPLK